MDVDDVKMIDMNDGLFSYLEHSVKCYRVRLKLRECKIKDKP